MWSFVRNYIDLSIKACTRKLLVLSYPHVIISGWGKSTPGGNDSKNQICIFFFFAVITTPVKMYTTSFNVFSKENNASWRHLFTNKGILANPWLFVLHWISNKTKLLIFLRWKLPLHSHLSYKQKKYNNTIHLTCLVTFKSLNPTSICNTF